jgi:hypothetical protein
MTQYNDIPQVSQLHAEQQRVQSAIAMIDGGGSLYSVTIAPAPPPPPDPEKGMGPVPAMMVMPATVQNTGPTNPQTMTAVRSQLAARDAEITAELASLGVTGSSTKKK